MGDMKQAAESVGRRADNDPWVERGIRFGMFVYGVVYLVIAWLALQLALGDSSGSASSTGALHKLAQNSFGAVLIWLVAFGMVMLVLWRLLEAAVGHQDEEGTDRVRKQATSVFKAVMYGFIAYSALKIALGAGSGSKKSSTDDTTATVMGWPAGQWIVGLVGLAIIAYGANQVRRAWTEKFREHLTAEGKSGETGRAYIMFGKVGYVAKGVSIALVGGLFVYAAVTHDPQKSGGLDQALHKLLQQPFGPILLGLIAVGLACYGLFCFARARHLSR
ncbi:DUF1206 domain-containing protein [Nocardioides sp. MAHUQ-72]|uniref:DUF1206 domain-containing protein n=1 Tax=unclassified Nocardioides TaxID=2615069 RepID=UPI003622B75B